MLVIGTVDLLQANEQEYIFECIFFLHNSFGNAFTWFIYVIDGHIAKDAVS